MLCRSGKQAAGSGFAPFQGREGTLSCEFLQLPLPPRIGEGTAHRTQFLERRSLARPNHRLLLHVSSPFSTHGSLLSALLPFISPQAVPGGGLGPSGTGRYAAPSTKRGSG